MNMESNDFSTVFDSDEFIFREGDPGDCAYIIESGLVELSLNKDGRRLVIATLSKGEIFGEMAIIDQLPRTASARAVVATTVTAIPLEYVSQKVEQSDPTVRMFLRLAMARYRDLNVRLGHVFEGLSPGQGPVDSDEIASTTMELKNVVSQFAEMQKRIDTAVSRPAHVADGSMFTEATLRDTKLRVSEEQLLKKALANGEFRLHYQPIVEFASKRIAGCEALVRWQHPSGKLVAPGKFIPIAENSGLIVDLGYWIAEQACQFQHRLASEFKQKLFVAINLSGKQFDDPLLIANLAIMMDTTGVRRELIKFEITESLLMDNPELAAESLHQLKETGAKLAIDDFGTGYSSFSYLHRFPFDTLKIDRAFISAMLRSDKSNRIVKSLVNLSHDLGMDVVAEGIESKREAELIGGYRARYGQGFYFAKPLPEKDLIKLLLRSKRKRAG